MRSAPVKRSYASQFEASTRQEQNSVSESRSEVADALKELTAAAPRPAEGPAPEAP